MINLHNFININRSYNVKYFSIKYPNNSTIINMNILKRWNKVSPYTLKRLKNNIKLFLTNSKNNMEPTNNIKYNINKYLGINGKFIPPISGIELCFKNGPLYRIRPVKSKSQVDHWKKNHKLVPEIINPPCNKVHSFGRLNKPHHSVLYTSWDVFTALKETHIHPGDLFIMSAFAINKPINLTLLGFGLYSIFRNDEVRLNLSHKYPTGYKIMKIYDKFLQDIFKQKVNPTNKYYYKYTNAIAYDFMNNINFISTIGPLQSGGWAYPSAKFNHKDMKKSFKHIDACIKPNNLNRLYLNGSFLLRATKSTDLYTYVERLYDSNLHLSPQSKLIL